MRLRQYDSSGNGKFAHHLVCTMKKKEESLSYLKGGSELRFNHEDTFSEN